MAGGDCVAGCALLLLLPLATYSPPTSPLLPASPPAFAQYHALHASAYAWFDIGFDYFGRTSCAEPWSTPGWSQTVIAQDIFRDLQAAGALQEQATEQVFCRGCAKFLADRFIEGECPLCHAPGARGDQCDACGKLLNATELVAPRCKADAGHAVELRSSRHLFLDLPRLEPQLRAWVAASSAGGRWTDNAVGVTEAWLKKGLLPRCITRDLKWGTPVPHPDFADKVFYVWFDAPIGYISMTAEYTPEWRRWWQNPEQVRRGGGRGRRRRRRGRWWPAVTTCTLIRLESLSPL